MIIVTNIWDLVVLLTIKSPMQWDNKYTPVHYVKNEVGQREAKIIHEDELQNTPKKKNIGVLFIGHVGHTQADILWLLNRNNHNIPADIVVIKQEHAPQYPVWSMEALIQNIESDIVRNLSDISDVMMDTFSIQRKQYPNPHVYTSPKPQKSKSQNRKYSPRKT